MSTRAIISFVALVAVTALGAAWLSVAAWNDDAVHMRLWETQFLDGTSLLSNGHFRAAEIQLRAAKKELQLCRGARPALTLTSTRLGLALNKSGHREEAIKEVQSSLPLMENACKAQPQNATLTLQLVNALNLLGLMYQEDKRFSESIASYRRVIDFVNACPAKKSTTISEACQSARKALSELDPAANKPTHPADEDQIAANYAKAHKLVKAGITDEALPLLESVNLALRDKQKAGLDVNDQLLDTERSIRAAVLIDLIDIYHSDRKLEQAANASRQLSDLNAVTMGPTAPATLERLEQSADFLYHAGRFNKAAERYRSVQRARLNLADKSDSKRDVELKRKLAQSLLQAGKTTEGLAELEGFLSLNGGFGASNPLAAQQLIEISHALDAAKMLPKGIPYLEQYFREHSSAEDGTPPIDALLTQLSRALEQNGQHLKSTIYRKRTVAATEKEYGTTSLKLREPLEGLAAAYIIAGKSELALAPLQHELAIISAAPKTKDTKVLLARQYGMIADAYLGQHDSAKIIEYARKAIELATEPAAAMTKADALGLLGSAAIQQGRMKEAYKNFELCLEQYEKHLPEFTKDTNYEGYKARMKMYATGYTQFKSVIGDKSP